MKMLCQDFRTMNAPLVDHFFSLMEETYSKDFTNMRITNPDMHFCECLVYFVNKYGETNESERATNKTGMKNRGPSKMAMKNCNCRLKMATSMPCSLASPSVTRRWSTSLSMLLARPECLETSTISGTNKIIAQKIGMTSRPSGRQKSSSRKTQQ